MITSIYAAISALILLYLSFNTIRLRRQNKVSLGDGDHAQLNQAIRAHANFIEYTPIALLLILLFELNTSEFTSVWPATIIHICGLLLIVGRVLHQYGLMQQNTVNRCRVIGMMCTFISIIISAASLLITSFM